jgi:hypothetical protein
VLYFLIFILLGSCFIAFMLFKKINVHTSTMAAVMSLGIITQGVLFNFFGMNSYEKILTVINLALWGSFSFSFFMTLFKKRFRELHYSNPINRFGIGTWVAGTSICTILIAKQFIEWSFIARILAGLNFGLWFIYIVISIRAFFDLKHKRLTKHVHGILLLTTVSTQSIVLVLSAVFKNVPMSIDHFFITLGLGFYLICGFIIIKRYIMPADSWSVETDWNNTNCILHGAMSITGLACIKSHSVSEHEIIGIWIFAATIFMLVESLEVFRLVKRIKRFGMKKGVLTYDVSQWSRIFTFGMFFTFTFLTVPGLSFLIAIKKTIISVGIWTIPILLILEVSLCTSFLIQAFRNYPKPLPSHLNDKINARF